MPVNCPHCSTRYVLPEALLGPGGARVRCPRCRQPFAVGADGVAELPPVAVEAVATEESPAPVPARSFSLAMSEPHAPSAVESPAAPANGGPVLVAREAPVVNHAENAAVPAEIKPAGPPRLPSVATASARAQAAAASSPSVETPGEIAREVLDELAMNNAEAIELSRSEGRLFREFGAVIAEAFEFYRRRVGPPADPAPFRAALLERWGVDLEPGIPPKRLI